MSRRHRNGSRRVGVLAAVGALIAALLTFVSTPAAISAPTVVASDLTGAAPVNLVSFTDDPIVPFTSPGDGFNVFQRGVSASIPFAVGDDSLGGFPGDTVGIIDESDLLPFFGITDTVNGDTSGPVTASWVFDISGGSDLHLSIDAGAMGDFESSDAFDFAYSIDGGSPVSLWSFVADEAVSRNYTMAAGAVVNLNDPLDAGAIPLSNVLQTITAPLVGSGSQLEFIVTATTDGGSEAVAFRNIVIASGAPDPVVGDLVITEVMQNPGAVGDSAGEWFEIKNTSALPIDLNGWKISDDDFDSHTITGSVVVAPGDYVVFGNNADSGSNGGLTVDYSYGGSWFLGNSFDEVVLSDPGGSVFDRISYDNGATCPDPTGAAMNLDPAQIDATSNDDGSNWCEATATFGAGDRGTPGADNSICAPPEPTISLIHDIQGSGSTVAISGPVKAQGIVTVLFERDDVLDGFFLQEEDADADADPTTSEGIFVFCREACLGAIAPGDLVTVLGSAGENFGMSQINVRSGSTVIDGSGNSLPTPSAVDLPASTSTRASATFENVEGMVVAFPDTLVVSEYFELARFGQVVLTESSRPFQFTHDNAPSVAGFAAFSDDLAKRRIILDDDSNDNNDAIFDGPDEAYYYPEGGLSTGNKFRGGDTITNLTGVMHWSWAGSGGTDAWRVRPIPAVYDYTFTPVNTAPASPSDVGGTLKVASFNVLNYFTTIDTTSSTSSGHCGASGTLDCRGADSVAELDRQRSKIVAAMAVLDADVLGLVELENDADDSSIEDLVSALNAAVGAGTYDYVPTGFIGTDAIKVGLIYKPASVGPLGDYAILDSSVDPTFIDTKNRPVLVQTFIETGTDERFTVAVNHLKSKGSSCADVGDPGTGDGQANCAGTRTAATTALATFLAGDPTGSADPDFLIIGDLNAYAKEDPIAALAGAGYTDLIAQFQGSGAYSFVFDGQLGYLDHALANSTLLGQVTGVTEWHINADEINVFDYNDDVRDAGERSFERESGVLNVFSPDPFRSSDHDPLLVGFGLDSIPDNPTCNGLAATIIGTPGDDVIVGTNKSDVIVTFGGDDVVDGGNGDDVICTGYGDDIIDGGNGQDYIDGGHNNDTILGGQGDDTLIGGHGDDSLDGDKGDDVLVGGGGDDTLLGGSGDDSLDGGDDSDNGDGGKGSDSCVGVELVVNCES